MRGGHNHKCRAGAELLGRMGALLLAALLSGCGARVQPEETASEMSALVKITAGEVRGSGVVYERREDVLVVVTAGHVLAEAAQAGASVEVLFGDGTAVETDAFRVSKTSETAFVNVSLDDLPQDRLEELSCVHVDKDAFDGLAEGEEMTFRGFSAQGAEYLGGTLLYPWIYVEDFAQYMMLVQGEILPGMSGGGLFDSEGNFVGILCGISDNRETAAVPLSVILAEYTQEY